MNVKEDIAARFDDVAPELYEISHWMYDNPEVGLEEFRASARLTEFLSGVGFEVEYPAYGMETAFAARAGSEGPEVVICAEYDALPEVGHACGHNIIAAAAAGAGASLLGIAGDLGVRVTVLGTPAEEGVGGKVDLIEAGAFGGAAAAMMVHPSPHDMLDPAMLAVAHLEVDYYGHESHAAFAPQVGINALDAAVQAYVNLSTLRQALYPTDKLHGVFTHGGGAPNVIPGHTSMLWYVRAATKERLTELMGRVRACFEAAATATGCRVEVSEHGHTYDEMKTDSVLADLFNENITKLGRTMQRAADQPLGAAGSTDMANVSQVVPSIHPMLGINCAPAVNHQKEFAAHTITADGDKAIRDGALAMAWTVADLAQNDRWGDLGR